MIQKNCKYKIGGGSINIIYCPTKDKNVCITQTMINAGALEDNQTVRIPGMIKCSDNDYNCDYENCPIRKRT